MVGLGREGELPIGVPDARPGALSQGAPIVTGQRELSETNAGQIIPDRLDRSHGIARHREHQNCVAANFSRHTPFTWRREPEYTLPPPGVLQL